MADCLTRLIFFFSLLIFSLLPLNAQTVLKGRVSDRNTGEGIPYADVIVSDMTDVILSATATTDDGTFTFDGLKPSEVILTVRMLGYEPYVSDRLSLSESQPVILDTILMYPSAAGLEQATVVGQKNRIVYKLDRQIISGSASVMADGGTAVDILSSTPSVLVDSDGTLSLRGSTNFLVYVDGRPSPLDGTSALQSIPAAEVEDIEIITTPSARYRTDGDVGIINITTKKARESGFSGVWKPVKWWNTTLNGSVFKYDFRSDTEYCTDRSGWYCMGVWSNTFNVGKDTKIQIDPHIVGPRILTQGQEDGYFFCDIAARQPFFKGRMSVSFVFHDVFRTAKYHKVRISEGLTSITDVLPKYPNILLSLTYNFNASSHKKTDITDSAMFEGKDF